MDNDIGSDIVPDETLPFTQVGGMLQRVPQHLASSLAPAAWIIHEWANYVLSYDGATTLRIGSKEIRPTVTSSDGVSHFTVRFENELGLTRIRPLRDGMPHGTGMHVEVLAKKFPTAEYSVAFLNNLLSDLFSRGASLPFDIVRRTERTIRDQNRAPSDLFAFHFFRHHHAALIRSVQAIMGGPHRQLADRIEHVRPHEVRRIESDSLRQLLITRSAAALPDTGVGGTALERLRPERVMQHLPYETHDTPENRYVISIARRMFITIRRIQKARWYQRVNAEGIVPEIQDTFNRLHHHLRQFVTDPRFAGLEESNAIPTQSRVLQRKDGYRELVQLWDAFHHYQEPVYEEMQRAIDIRDTPTLYEYWLLFELVDAISRHTGVRPVLGGYNDLLQPGWRFRARFPEVGTLTYQESYGANDVYSGINIRPDFVWQTKDGRRVILDAKFAVSYPWPDPNATEEENFERSHATSGDISAMHAYRDAIKGVSAAIVLFPGTDGMYHPVAGPTRKLQSLSDLLPELIDCALDGIGAIPITPVTSEKPKGHP